MGVDFWSAIEGYRNVKPAERKAFGEERPTVKDLPEGKYTFKIVEAATKFVGKDGAEKKPLLALGLRITTGPVSGQGQVFEQQYWLTDENSSSQCFADMITLGMPAQGQLPDLLKAFLPQLVGKSYQANRKDSVSSSNGKTYHNCYIRQLVGGTPMAQPGFAPTAPNTAAEADIMF